MSTQRRKHVAAELVYDVRVTPPTSIRRYFGRSLKALDLYHDMNYLSANVGGLNETVDLCKLVIFLVPNTQLDPRPDTCCELFSGQEFKEGVGHVQPYTHAIESLRKHSAGVEINPQTHQQ